MVVRLDAASKVASKPEISVGQALDTALNNSNADGQEESMDPEHALVAVARVAPAPDAGLITPAARDRALEYQNKLQESGQFALAKCAGGTGPAPAAQIEEVLNGAQGTAKTLLEHQGRPATGAAPRPRPVRPPKPARAAALACRSIPPSK
ncbi:MAG: hypothetical protein R3E96_07470 [Planctomycetota bacterium]